MGGIGRRTTSAPTRDADVVQLRRAGVSLVVRLNICDLPTILHWGPDLGDHPADLLAELIRSLWMPGPDDGIDPHSWATVLPQHTAGWLGRPGLQGNRDGQEWTLTFARATHEVTRTPDADILHSVATDETAGVEVSSEIELLTTGLVRVRGTVTNLQEAAYEVTILEPALPVPNEAQELLDMGGRPGRERVPQRRPFDQGLWMRESRGGRPGHDSATVMCAGRPGFGFRSGRVWGVHLAWSGNQNLYAEHSYTGWKLLRGGELLGAHEVVLERGESYTSPWLYASWGEGLDEFSSRFHDHLRARPSHPHRPRPVLLNTWEAMYFDLDLTKLIDLAHRAADLGVERYVLDDGWFQGRRDDTSSLGDWVVDTGLFPEGLDPLVRTVQSLGMEFGLWFEPEMVNRNSDLARQHPDWVLRTHAGPGIASRSQHVLDLSNPDAWDHIYSRIAALVSRHEIGYIKWDHNRPLIGAGRGPDHTPAAHRQTDAVYRMMAELRQQFPVLEIETCCGGGGRLDLGVMHHASRAWVSDCQDAHERHRMVRWTGLILPPELMGTHIGSPTDHSTGRRHTLAFRAGTAMFGHMGIECDIVGMSEEERQEMKTWISLYKTHRSLLHSGCVVRADHIDPALQLDGAVAQDRGEAIYKLSALGHTHKRPAGRVPLPGLDPDATYRVKALPPALTAFEGQPPAWYDGGVVMTGKGLEEIGVSSPLLLADDLIILHARRVRPHHRH